MKNRKTIVAVLLVLALSVGLVAIMGCAGTQEKKTVEMVYVNWAEGIAMTNLAKVAMEEHLGVNVTIQVADVGPVYTSLAQGDKDAFLDAWLPVTHADYMDRFADQIEDLGYTFRGARIGLVVPDYVEFDSITEMNEYADNFDGEIIGIDAGAGIMKASEKAIETYGLDYKLVASSGPAMTASLSNAIEDGEWEVVTGWKPHWKFARWDLKFLEDPEKVYGAVENIHAVARKGLKEDMPKVYQFLKNFEMNDQQLGSLMGAIADSDADPEVAVRSWLQEPSYAELVKSWVPDTHYVASVSEDCGSAATRRSFSYQHPGGLSTSGVFLLPLWAAAGERLSPFRGMSERRHDRPGISPPAVSCCRCPAPGQPVWWKRSV